MQAYLNIDSPCAGTMFQASTWHGRHAFAVPPRGRLGVECEIAVRLARYVDYPSLDTPTLIADDFFHHACVLGPPSESMRPEALRDVTASMTINGVQVGRGTGTDILGEPLQVLCWLANNAAAWGTPLLAGDVILLGSLVQTQWVQAGDAVTVTNDPLGEAAGFTAGRVSRRCSAGCPDADTPMRRRCRPARRASRPASARAAGYGPNGCSASCRRGRA